MARPISGYSRWRWRNWHEDGCWSATSIEPTPALVKRLGALGTSTVHEAYGRIGLMKPYLRPVWAGRRSGGHRRDRAGAARRQLDDPCRGRAVPARRHPGGRLHRRQYRRHVRRSAGDLAEGARRRRPGHRRRLPRREVAARDGLSGVVEGDFRQGHGQGDARRRQRSRGLRRRQRPSRRCRGRRR